MANANPATDWIHARLTAAGRLPWAEVMRLALYEPGLGYYRHGPRRIGRSGDFFTSVSVGPVFGELLASYCAQVWRSLGSPGEFAIIEQGAHDGTLASDLLHSLQAQEPALFQRLRYLIVEPDDELRIVQRTTLAEWKNHVAHVADLTLPPQFPGHAVFLCNELLDAFPVHRVTFDAPQARWQESFVENIGGALSFTSQEPTNTALQQELRHLPGLAPHGSNTEINLEMLDWLRQLAQLPFAGTVLILDYGFTTESGLPVEQSPDTLRRYHEHQSDSHVLEELGACDLTSHVNFTRLAAEAESLQMPVLEFIEQGRFLTRLATPRLGDPAHVPDSSWLRQFQTLAHPGMMGRHFHALVLAKDGGNALPLDAERRSGALRRLGL